jgi:hypothetical protein
MLQNEVSGDEMFKFIGKALTSVVLTQDAQVAVKKARDSKPVAASQAQSTAIIRPAGKAMPVAGSRSAVAAASASKSAAASGMMRAQGKHLMTPEREALIKYALKVRAAKQSVVANLSDEARANLVGIALIGLLRADEPPKA